MREVPPPGQEEATLRLRSTERTGKGKRKWCSTHGIVYAKAQGRVGSWPILGTTALVVGGGCQGWPRQTSEDSVKRVKKTYLTSNGKPLKSLQQEGGMNKFGF